MKNICGIRIHIKPFRILILFLTCVVVASLAGCGDESVRDQAYSAQDDAATTTQAGAAAQSGSSPGISSTESPFGMHPASIGGGRDSTSDSFAAATDMGVGWAREGVYAFWFLIQPDLNSPDYDFSLHDKQWGLVPAGIQILGNISPQGPRDEGRCLKGSFMPVDEDRYAAFVRATIERYDGDGVDDMPGLTNPIKYWQVGNEPDGSRVKDFASLQRITYTAIKESCADCMVLIGGVPGFPSDYISGFESDYAPILKELNGAYVDIFDFHWYGQATGDYRLRDSAVTVTGNASAGSNSGTGSSVTGTGGGADGTAADSADVLAHIRQTLSADGFPADMPVWITEMGSYSGDPSESGGPPGRQAQRLENPPQSERQQAQDTFKRFIYPLSRGVDKVFLAFGLMEGFKHEDGYFDHTGLIYDGEGAGDPGRGVKKLSYYTYKKMSEKLTDADWSTIMTLHDGTGGDHLYLFRIMRDEEEIYIAWWDYYDEAGYMAGDTKSISLDEIDANLATVTRVVPRAGSGRQMGDYATAFETLEIPIEDGGLDVALNEDPVIIELSSP
ncbi:MAG: hypothetical protein ACYC6O_09275 [Thermoleophilia bacterium]